MNDHTSKNFDLELESLRTRVLEMGGMAEQQVLKSIEGLYSGDRPLLEAVIRDDDRINQMEIEIDALCNQVIAKRQPQLLAIGRHNRGVLAQTLLSSLAQHYLTKPPCDVLVVR